MPYFCSCIGKVYCEIIIHFNHIQFTGFGLLDYNTFSDELNYGERKK